jgi:hypothetical protein
MVFGFYFLFVKDVIQEFGVLIFRCSNTLTKENKVVLSAIFFNVYICKVLLFFKTIQEIEILCIKRS